MKITILGCGPSGGVPGIGPYWGACDPENPKNRRLRPSILVQDDTLSLLVDTSPDLRQQLLSVDYGHLDAVLYTHGHADHLHGIDDLRSINRQQNEALDIYLNQETLDDISQRFGYVLDPLAEGADVFYKPVLVPHVVQTGQVFSVNETEVMPIVQDHGYCETIGFRIGDFAYSTDVVNMPEESFELLKGIKVWVIGTLIDTPHTTHADVDKALRWIERIAPQRAFLTHLGSGLDYNALTAKLPDHVRPCYDGLEITL
ncbi:putative Metal-dependent hydrolase [Candidatus Terasakiella magnetica]|uniref:Putative Metal-dependent hydrolase n=1 Tax=Candidatus Terasakiella magnetica TaxID=1867952 RepID=A0A1C3RD65_9PROT|nr:MBL fold metallo-hydrolase [Candidatus Terasakiella magnetica]SCA55181.1 putative Metal-dependent hydrolase [Candidatus Terasakiella magnetica]